MIAAGKNIAVLVNPLAGSVKAHALSENIDLLLKGMSVEHTIYRIEWPRQLEGFTDAWIVGGDGTLNYFINHYPDTRLPLSIFPGGTGNDFHWMLYGEMKTEEQVEILLTLAPSNVDAGKCNGKLFLNGIGIGFDGAIVKDLLGRKKRPGKASYLLSILKHIVGYKEKVCNIEIGREQTSQPCFMISVANGRRYGGGFHVAPKAILNDGLLDISIIGKISAISRLRYLPVMEKGEHLQLPFIRYVHHKGIHISVDEELHAHADGEYFSAREFDVEVLKDRFSFVY